MGLVVERRLGEGPVHMDEEQRMRVLVGKRGLERMRVLGQHMDVGLGHMDEELGQRMGEVLEVVVGMAQSTQMVRIQSTDFGRISVNGIRINGINKYIIVTIIVMVQCVEYLQLLVVVMGMSKLFEKKNTKV